MQIAEIDYSFFGGMLITAAPAVPIALSIGIKTRRWGQILVSLVAGGLIGGIAGGVTGISVAMPGGVTANLVYSLCAGHRLRLLAQRALLAALCDRRAHLEPVGGRVRERAPGAGHRHILRHDLHRLYAAGAAAADRPQPGRADDQLVAAAAALPAAPAL